MEDERFAVAAEAVLEVIEIPSYVEVPGSVAWFAGMTIYKAEPIAVVDLPAFVFDLARATIPAQRAMVVSAGWGKMVFLVQRIDGLVHVSQTVGPAQRAAGGSKFCFESYQSSDGETLQVLNLARLCSSDEFLNPADYGVRGKSLAED